MQIKLNKPINEHDLNKASVSGYYMVLVTKAAQVGQIGYHTICKIEEVQMIYVPSDSATSQGVDEQRYVRLFQVTYILYKYVLFLVRCTGIFWKNGAKTFLENIVLMHLTGSDPIVILTYVTYCYWYCFCF